MGNEQYQLRVESEYIESKKLKIFLFYLLPMEGKFLWECATVRDTRLNFR